MKKMRPEQVMNRILTVFIVRRLEGIPYEVACMCAKSTWEGYEYGAGIHYKGYKDVLEYRIEYLNNVMNTAIFNSRVYFEQIPVSVIDQTALTVIAGELCRVWWNSALERLTIEPIDKRKGE